ncbi:MAG: HD domain-containing phosphohydrolase [Planctomycetota bacterium]
MASSDSVSVKTEQLPVGSKLSHPVNDGDGRLLLASGVTLTKRLKDRLLARGITEVLLHPDDVAALFGGNTSQPPTHPKSPPRAAQPARSLEKESAQQTALREAVASVKVQAAALASSVSRKVQNAGPALSERQKNHGTAPYDHQQRERLTQHFAVTAHRLAEIAKTAVAGRIDDDQTLAAVTEDYVAELTDDTDNVIATSRELAPSPALTERGIRLALLGMAMAIEMDWDEHNVREVGLCGLVHDFGMYRLDERLRDQRSKLSAADFREITDHPLHTLDMLSSMQNISLTVRLAATQVHENPDGSGYPRGITADEIHPYAALLQAADAYISLTAEMHGRPAYLSYDAIVYLLNQVKAGRIDEQSMRALLQVVALFPIGSHVRLSDGTEAQVIRRNGGNYTAPIVQRVGADRKAHFDSAHASIIDLAAAKMSVMSPLVPPDSTEERLDESLMAEVLWNGITS